MELKPSPSTDKMESDSRNLYALVIAVIGLLIPALLIVFLVYYNAKTTGRSEVIWKASEITAAAGLFTSIVGTLVGAFLGVQAGAAGKEFAERTAQQAMQHAEALREEIRQLKESLPNKL